MKCSAVLQRWLPRVVVLHQGAIQQRVLKRTGENVSCLGMVVASTSWDYSDGQSEIRMGKALRDGYRQRAFLMTKFDGRTKDSAAKQIDESLKRLQTDHLDLRQFHENIRFKASRPAARPKP